MADVDNKSAMRLAPEHAANRFAELAGVWQGQVQIAEDFDELPDDPAERLGMAE